MQIKISEIQPQNKDYINIANINGFYVGVIHKNKIIDVLKRGV